VARRIVALVAVAVVALAVVAVVLTRSGGDHKGGSSTTPNSAPRAEALAYVPANSPAVIGVDTGSPTASLLFGALVPRISGGALTANDISPLLGNEAVVALLDPRTQRGQLSMVANDPDALRALTRRLKPNGSYRGAQLFAGPQGSTVAVDGQTVLAALDQGTVRRALDTRANKNGMTPAQFDRRLAGLPRSADVRAIFDPKRAVVQQSLPGVLNTRWGRSLTNGAVELTEGGTGILVPFALQTDARRINDLDLPFGTGARPPTIRGNAPLLIGVDDTARLVAFLRGVDPKRFGNLDSFQRQLPSFLRVNVNGLLNSLHDEGTISSADRLQHFALRTNPPDPNAWRQPLQRLSTLSSVLQRLGIDNVKLDEEGANGYRLVVDDELAARVALFGPTLVLTDDARTDLRATATAPPAPTPPGARGGLTLRMTADEGRRLLSSLFGLPASASAVLARLGALTGWARASTSSVRGELQLGLR
jgi:hypothetical protein